MPLVGIVMLVALVFVALGLSGGPGLCIFGGSMYSYSQLVALAQSAGFQGNDAFTAAGIAVAESSGNPRAYNPEMAAGAPAGKGSFGLWQIYLNVHPEFTGQDLYDPATNAAAAFSVWKEAGGSFAPWSTFKNGAYAQFVQSCGGTLA